MRYRPLNWPLVCIGLMGVGIGIIGILFHLLSSAEHPKPVPMASGIIAGIGVASILLGWFYDPRD